MNTRWMTEPEAAGWLLTCSETCTAMGLAGFAGLEFVQMARVFVGEWKGPNWICTWPEYVEWAATRFTEQAVHNLRAHVRRERDAADGFPPRHVSIQIDGEPVHFWTGRDPRWLISARAYAVAAAVLRSVNVTERPAGVVLQ